MQGPSSLPADAAWSGSSGIPSAVRAARFPFRVGQVLVGDDPFNGHQLGTVAVVTPPVVGLRAPGRPAGRLFSYDYRHLTEPQ
jgi:hypothetical protein